MEAHADPVLDQHEERRLEQKDHAQGETLNDVRALRVAPDDREDHDQGLR